MYDRENHSHYESREQYYWRKSKERYARAEQTIAIMAMIALNGPDEITQEQAVYQACDVFKLIRASDGAILKSHGLDLQFFGAPPVPVTENENGR